ncbi:MAG: WD40 repeat domain-containing protein, partial [Pseudonocardiaceae bacterium]
VVTPGQRQVVAIDAQGGIRVIGDEGQVEEAKAPHLAGTVVTAATSPSASHVALATDQGSVAVIDVGTDTQIDLTTDGSSVLAVSWLDSSPDNLVLVVTSSGLAATYSATTGQPVTQFPSTVDEALPTADGQIVTSDRDSRLRVWDARTAAKAAESSPLSSPIGYLQRYGHEVVGVTWDGNIIRWDWRGGNPEPLKYPFYFSNFVSQVTVSEDTHTVTIASDKEANTYSLDDGSPQHYLPQQPAWVSGVALDPRGQFIATAGDDGRVRVWSAKGIGIPNKGIVIPNRATYELIAHRGGVQRVSYLRDGEALVSLGFDGTVRLWEVPQVQRFDLHSNWVLDLGMSADGRWLATASSDGNVNIVDPTGASNVPVATVPVGSIVGEVQADPTDPHRIVTLVLYGKQPEMWRWHSGREAERLPEFEAPPLGPSDGLVSLDISHDGKRVAAGDSRGNVYLWDAHTGKLIGDRALTGSGQAAYGIAFDLSGRMLAATGPEGVRLKKLGTTEEPKRLELPDATSVAFDPRGEHIVGGAPGGDLRIWTRDGQLVHELIAHGSMVGGPSFSGDGGLVTVGTAEGLIEVWNVESGRTVMLARQHGDSVNDVLFLPGDRSRLISASDDLSVAVSRCDACEDPDAVVRDAERWLGGSN